MHYVSSKPVEIPNHVHAACADINSKTAFAKQAAVDWQNILLARAAELVPGGRFICLNFGIDAEGRYLGNTGGKHMFDHFHKFWKALYEKGASQKANMKVPLLFSITEQWKSFVPPFQTPIAM